MRCLWQRHTLPLRNPERLRTLCPNISKEGRSVVGADHHPARRLSVFVHEDVDRAGAGTDLHRADGRRLPTGSRKLHAGEPDQQRQSKNGDIPKPRNHTA